MLLLIPASAFAAPPKASSEATDSEGQKHPASHAFDGLLGTSWAEGEMGEGEGAWIELRFDKPVDVSSVSLWPGWLGGSDREVREYARPRRITLKFEVAGGDPVERQEVLLDPGADGPLRHDVVIDAPKAKSMRLTVDEAYKGGIHSDLHVAEIAVNFTIGQPNQQVVDVGTWLESEAGQKLAGEQREQAIALFDKISGEQFGDRESLNQLMAWAGDGAPYLREKVAKSVPDGFRIAALQPDKTSVEALLKLKDSNAIPAIRRAALRTTGALREDLERRAKMFEAYQDLIGGANRPVQPWGASGFAKGALQSFGEPLDIQVDAFGGVWVADVANHRVQKYGIDTGLADRVWGAKEPQLTDLWFYKTRDPYAAGAAPSAKDGEFSFPVDLAVVPDKKLGDSVIVLDTGVAEAGHKGSWGRLTHIAADGSVAHTQSLPFDTPIAGGVGGEGHVVVAGKNVIVVWGNEGVAYSLKDWSEVGRFEVEDGVPNGAVGFSNGKLGLVYEKDLVLYSIDGFRHGALLGDTLGQGFQDWSATVDERGKLWVVLDTGDVIKYKKPGKVDFRFVLGDYSLEAPRIAVIDDNVFVTSRDGILRGDALELQAQQAAGEERSNLDVGGDL